jgi:hypothetical protein
MALYIIGTTALIWGSIVTSRTLEVEPPYLESINNRYDCSYSGFYCDFENPRARTSFENSRSRISIEIE